MTTEQQLANIAAELVQARNQLTIIQTECTRLLQRTRELERSQRIAGALAAVRDFHIRFGVPVERRPHIPEPDRLNLRAALIREEADETIYAIETANLVEVADGLARSDLCVPRHGPGIRHSAARGLR